jgi:hypothetical protein
MPARTKTTGRKFFSPGPASDPAYAFCLNEPEYAYIRERIEAMWAKYEPYCPDANFLAEARSHFVERTWEMRLACVFLERGFPLVSRAKDAGPDVCIDTTPRIWVEATAVSAGTGPNRVPDRPARAFTVAERGYTDEELPDVGWHGRPPSEESVILRCTQALKEKRDKYLGYLRAGIVKLGEPYVVAMSLAGIEDAFYLCDYDHGTPVFVKALFGIGAEHILLSSQDGERARMHMPPRPFVTTATGAEVAAHAFASSTYPEISGVFGSCTDIVNAPLEPGREIMYVNNPRADSPIASGTFDFGMEFVGTERGSKGTVERRDRRKPYDLGEASEALIKASPR